jgi:hypothetical protein
MPTRQEKSTFRHCEGVYASLLVAGNTKKSNYGQLLHNIGWLQPDDYGIFLLDDGTVKAYKIREVDAATDRIVHGVYETSTYKQGLEYGKHRIKIVRQNIFNGPGGGDKEQTNRVLKQLMDEALLEFRAGQPPPRTKYPTSIVKLTKNKKPKIASPTGSAAVYPELRFEIDCGWCAGKIVQFNKANEHPYLLKWDTNPPSQTEVKEADVMGLLQNYKFCKDRLILNGVVGRELLWPCLPVGVNRDSKLDYLKCVKVMSYTPVSSLYALSFRTGNVFYLTPEDVDKATERDEAIRQLEPVHIDFNLKDTPLVRFKQVDINNASLELACYKRVGRDNELGKVVSISQSDGLSDSEDELKKLRVNLGKAVAASRRNLESKTTRKGTRSQKDVTNITTEVSTLLLTLYMK